jgi:hypothetical protein
MPNKPIVLLRRPLPETRPFGIIPKNPANGDHRNADAVKSAAFEDLNHAVSIAAIVRSIAWGNGVFSVLATVAFSAALY